MPLYLSELSPAQLETYHQSFYKKIDYTLRSGTSCFATLAYLTMEEIDAMEIGGFPSYYVKRPLYDRPPEAQIQAKRAAKKLARKAKRIEEIKKTLQAEGPQSMEFLAERLVELLDDLLQEDAIVLELVGWVEGESGLLCCSETKRVEEEAAAFAAAEEILVGIVDQVVAACSIELPVAEEVSCSEVPAAACSKAVTASIPTFEELWPSLPSRPSVSCRQLPAAAAAKSKDLKKIANTRGDLKKVGKQEQKTQKPRQSRIQGYIQNPSLLKGLPLPTLVLQPLFPHSK
jgi:hypothetical protein